MGDKKPSIDTKAAQLKERLIASRGGEPMEMYINHEKKLIKIVLKNNARGVPSGVMLCGSISEAPDGCIVIILPFERIDSALSNTSSGEGRYSRRPIRDPVTGKYTDGEFVVIGSVGIPDSYDRCFEYEKIKGIRGMAGVAPMGKDEFSR